MNFDPRYVPFSRYGSYMVLSHLAKSEKRREGLYLRSAHGDAFLQPEVFRIELLHKKMPVPFREIATPPLLRLQAQEGYAEICIPEPKLLRIKGTGIGIRLTKSTDVLGTVIPVGHGRWEINSFSNQIKYMLTPIKGSLFIDAPWKGTKCDYIVASLFPDPNSGVLECGVEEFHSVWHKRNYPGSFQDSLKTIKNEYQEWLNKMPEVPQAYGQSRELAAYITWSCVVAPEGHLTRPAMYMSKNWMMNLWSWDNCFNAMALVYRQPELAWDQFAILMDSQDVSGAFPDALNDKLMSWNFCKPPIHGWTLKWMMHRTSFIDKKRLKEVYEPLCRWTQWWFKYRDDDHDDIPQYNHGNDSGWDNCTVFSGGVPIESPDLSAYLIIQMDVLADVALRLGKRHEAEKWKAHANELLKKMLIHSWRGSGFVAPRSKDHRVFESDSLFLFLPIILGSRLPNHVLAKLITGLKKEGRFLTQYGFASESPQSPLYQANGYWRGPIWAPSTMIIIDGLVAAGEKELAREVASKFCDMVSGSGMAENFDAITGVGLCDPAHTWTCSVFLVLAKEYLEDKV